MIQTPQVPTITIDPIHVGNPQTSPATSNDTSVWDKAKDAAAGVILGPAGSILTGDIPVLPNLGDLNPIPALTNGLTDTIKNVGIYALLFGLILLGILGLFLSTEQGQDIAKDALIAG